MLVSLLDETVRGYTSLTYRLDLEAELVAVLPRTGHMELGRTFAAQDDCAVLSVAQRAGLQSPRKSSAPVGSPGTGPEPVGTHVLPSVLRDRAQALDEPEAHRVGVADLGDEHRTENVYPRLTLCRFACPQVRVGRGVDELLLWVSSHAWAQETVRDLRDITISAALREFDKGKLTRDASSDFSFWQRSHTQESMVAWSRLTPHAPACTRN